MKKIWLLFALTLFMSSAVVVGVQAKQKFMGGLDKRFGDMGWMKEQLGLTDKQVEQIGEINLNYQNKKLDFKEKNELKKIQFQRLLLETDVNTQKVRTVIQDLANIKAETDMLKVLQWLDIEKVLTPGQRTKLRSFQLEGPKDKKKKNK
jgi:Spy/CpxP family protein refolding chaperone